MLSVSPGVESELSPAESLPQAAMVSVAVTARTASGERSESERDVGAVMEVPYKE
jgi:hypothetical protein